MAYSNGDRYVGNWLNDQMCDSKGQYFFANGDKYYGAFELCPSDSNSSQKFGMIHGKGTFFFLNVGFFKGNFNLGLVSGEGVFHFIENLEPINQFWEKVKIS